MDFYANLSDGAWWTSLQAEMLGERLRFVTAVQKVGSDDSGLLAVTVYAELGHPAGPDQGAGRVELGPVLDIAPADTVTLAYTDRSQDRAAEVEDLIRQTLRRAVQRWLDTVG